VTTKQGVLVPSFPDFTNDIISPKFRPRLDCVGAKIVQQMAGQKEGLKEMAQKNLNPIAT
jgi:hypothetical protein